MPNQKIDRATASWVTPYADDVWSRLNELKSDSRIDVDEARKADWVALGPVLHDDIEPRIAHAFVHRRREQGSDEAPEIHWMLAVSPAPRSPPPELVREQDAKLGGRLGLMKLLADAAPQVGAGAFNVKVLVERSGWRCKVLPAHVDRGSAHELAMSLGRNVWVEQVGYRFDGGASGLEELVIIYQHEKHVFAVNILANGVLKLTSPTWLPYADEIADLVLSTFFAAEGGQGTP